MARPERTDFRARYCLLSGDFPALAKGGSRYFMVESFGFWGRESRVRDVEVITAESAGFSEEKDESLQTLLVYTSGASHWGVGPLRV